MHLLPLSTVLLVPNLRTLNPYPAVPPATPPLLSPSLPHDLSCRLPLPLHLD